MSVSDARAEASRGPSATPIVPQAVDTTCRPAARRDDRAIETRIQVRRAIREAGASRLILRRRKRGQPRSGLLGRLRQCRRRPGMRRLYPNAWYRASAHPARASGGLRPALVSRSSRRRMSARTSASLTGSPAGPNSSGPPARPHLRRRGDEDLHVGVREDHGADVAAVEHGARAGVRPKSCWKSSSAARTSGKAETIEAASPISWLLSAASSNRAGSSARAAATARAAIVEPLAGVEQRLRHRPVEQPGVEMAQPVMGGEPLAERALAGRRRSVDGDDHDRSALRGRASSARSSGSSWR